MNFASRIRLSIAAVLVTLTFGCGEQTTSPTTTSAIRAHGPERIYECNDPGGCPDNSVYTTYDSCATDSSDSCHPVEVTYFAPSPDPAYSAIECPRGCRTYEMTYGMGGKARLLLQMIKPTAECTAVRDWVLKALDEGRIRWYNEPDGNWGDTHAYVIGGQRLSLYDRIHLYSANFSNDHQFLMTLLHEGYHSYYEGNSIMYEQAAEGFAGYCAND